MADSSTKPEFWLISLGFIIIITYALLMFGNSLSDENSNATLDTDSSAYLTSYTARLNTSGITVQAETKATNSSALNPLEKALGGIKEFFDVFGVFTLLKNVFVGLWGFIALMFNIPSFIIETLGFDIKNFQFIINAVVGILTLSATIMIVRLTK